MSNWKYATVRKGSHNHGRIHMQLQLNKKDKTLTVDIKKAQDLNAEPSEDKKKGLNISCRIQILQQCVNASDSARVYDSLFTMQELEDSRFKRNSAKHFATNSPSINESYVFPLQSVWGQKLAHLRLYVAIVADEVVCSDGTGCVGCMSFGLEEIVNKKGQWPDQFWLLSQTDGLYKNEEVTKSVTFDSENASLTHIVVKGRVRANLAINGTYFCQGKKLYNKRYIYKHEKNGLWLSFHEGRKCWIIADMPGSNAPIAYVEDDATTPDLIVTKSANPQSTKMWMVFSRERRFVDGRNGGGSDAQYEPDEHVLSYVAMPGDLISNVQNEDAPAFDPSIIEQGRVSIAAKVQQANYFAGRTADPLLVPPTAPLSPKAKNIVRFIASEQQFLENMRNLNIIRMTMFSQQDRNAFAVIPQMMNATNLVLEEFRIAQSQDRNLERPVGALLMDLFATIAEPMLDYCTALDIKIQQVESAMKRLVGGTLEVSETTRDALSALGGISGVIRKLPCAFMQVQRYPHYILAVQKAAAPNDKDQAALFIAWQKYNDLAQQTVKVAGRLELNQKEKAKPNKLPPPLVSTSQEGDDLMKHPYYHGEIARAKAVELFQKTGENGFFLVRKMAGDNKYFLSYAAEGRLLHQQIDLITGGKFFLGREFANLNSLVLFYGSPRTNLVGPLTKPCIRS